MKFKNIIFKLGCIMCSYAFLTAITSLDNMCIATYYQPEAPESLAKYRKY